MTSLFFSAHKGRRLPKRRGCLRKAIAESGSWVGVPVHFSVGDWCSYWHQHLDWAGRSDYSPRIRKLYLAGYARVFRHLASISGELRVPFQLWITIFPHDSGSDCVFLHTPNPHSAFPTDQSDVDWCSSPSGLFTELLSEFSIREGRNEHAIFFYAENVGISLQNRPNQALEPTTPAVTIRADARLAPVVVVAHL